MPAWLTRLLGGEEAAAPAAARPRAFRPGLEVLEDRSVPALAFTSAGGPALVQNLTGGGVNFSNVTLKSGNNSAGTFTGGQQALGFDSGIVLSTGNINDL